VLISQAIALAGLIALLPFVAVPGGWYLLTAAVAGAAATSSLARGARADRRQAGDPAQVRLTFPRVAALAAIGVSDIVANGSYALAASGGELSVAAVLASLYPVVTALLARGILAERLRAVQSVGVAAALCGVIMLSA